MAKEALFSNGTEYMCFTELFCDRCVHNKTDDFGMPVDGNCPMEDAMARGESNRQIEAEFVPTGRMSRWACPRFRSDDPNVQENYISTMRELEPSMTPAQRNAFHGMNPDVSFGKQQTIQEATDGQVR